MQTGFALTKFIDHLASIADLTEDDLQLLGRTPCKIAHYARQVVLRKGEDRQSCCLLLRGYLCWKDAESEDGQITSIHVPGDVPDLQTVTSPVVRESLCTLGSVVVGFAPHSSFRQLSVLSPNLNHALSLLMINDASCARNWIVNLGSRNSLARAAHLICEIAVRLLAIGQGKDFCFPSPFTQSDLAAACGITAVHANRIIQELRRLGMLRWHSGMITIKDWHGLARIARFTPDYLGLRDPETLLRDAPSPLTLEFETAQAADAGVLSVAAAASRA